MPACIARTVISCQPWLSKHQQHAVMRISISSLHALLLMACVLTDSLCGQTSLTSGTVCWSSCMVTYSSWLLLFLQPSSRSFSHQKNTRFASIRSMASGNGAAAGSELAVLGGGCFWCLEACYQQLKGVSKVVSGYAGGHVDNPTYEQVGSSTENSSCQQVG